MVKPIDRNNQFMWILYLGAIIPIMGLGGCNRDDDDARVYHVLKESSPSIQIAPSETVQPETNSLEFSAESIPQVKYQLPENWHEKPPSGMRAASISALGINGQSADLSVIPLPIIGHDLELINMWRSQVQLPSTTDPDAVNQAVPVAIGSEQGRLFSFVSEQPSTGKSRQEILVATVTRGNMSWFFKMNGEEAFVASQKENFTHFLKSVRFVENVPEQMVAVPTAQSQNPISIWTIPTAWKTVPPSQFLFAEFSASGANGIKAEIDAAEFDNGAGGELVNVNRWRGQLGLTALEEKNLPEHTQTVDIPNGKGILVDFVGVETETRAPERLIGVMVSENREIWFYRLVGDKQIVAQQKNAFIKFIQSANYANVH